MDMKNILKAFDNATSKPKVAGVNDMSRFVSIIKEGAKVDKFVADVKKSEKSAGHSDKEAENIAWATANKKGMLDNKNKKTEAIVTGFEEGSLGGDANGFLLAADNINDLVMSSVDKIKINANEEKLKDMMAKFNAFMSAYHAVGKEILQPELFGEATVNELSKDTLSNYSDKADMDIVKKHRVRGPQAAAGDKAAVAKTDKKINKRMAGIDKAAKKINNESIEEAGYRSRDAYQRDYDSSRTGFGKQSRAYQADGGANDEYNTPEYDPAFEKNKQESTMYNIKVDGKVINPKPILGRTNAIQWAKGQAETAGLDLKTAMLSQVKYGESVAEGLKDTVKQKAKEFGKYMTEPDTPQQAVVRDRAKNIAKIRKNKEQGVAEGVAESLSLDDALKVLRQYGADHFKTTSNELHFYKNGQPFSVDLIFNRDATRSVSLSQLNSAGRKLKGQGVAEGSLNEFAPDGFNGGGDDGDEFSPEMAKMAQKDGFIKGASLADGATLERAMKIQDWDQHDGGMYKQYFAIGFKAGRMDKIKFNNKQYNLNLKLMKDGSIRHGKKQGVAEGKRTMSRAAKGNEKYGKDGMKALAKAGREGASEKELDKIRDKHDNYNEGLSFKDYLKIAESRNKG